MPSTTLNLGRVKGSMWYTGTADSNVDIASALTSAGYTPIKLDMYLNTSNGNVYQYAPVDDGLQWTLKGNLRGAKGADGITPLVPINQLTYSENEYNINFAFIPLKANFNRTPIQDEIFNAVLNVTDVNGDYLYAAQAVVQVYNANYDLDHVECRVISKYRISGQDGADGTDALVYYGETIRITDPLSINQIMNFDKSKFNREPVFGEYFVAIIKFFESFDDYFSGIYKTYLGYYEVNNANGVDSDGETIIVFAVLRTFVETTGADGADGQGGAQGRGYYRSEMILSTETTSIARSKVDPTNCKLLVSDTIVDKNGLVFAVTKECDVGDETVYIAYRTSIKGADGQGVPKGGVAGQILAKKTDNDYDTEWIDAPSGGTIGNNVLKSDVNFTSMAAVLDYALNLEIGKLYKLTWTFNGTSYSQTTYCWKQSTTNMTMLGTVDAGGGGEAILINPDNAGDGTIIIMDKMYANPATEESYPSENNATILAIQNYANLTIQSIKEVGTYTPPIPIPTSADHNKILQVQGTQYTLIASPAVTRSLYRHDVQIMSSDSSNRPAFAQCVILDYSSVAYNYDRLFSLMQKMTTITAVGTVVVERSDGKKTQGNVIGIAYNSSDGKIKIMSTYIDSDTSTSISQNDFEVPSDYQIYDYVTKIE